MNRPARRAHAALLVLALLPAAAPGAVAAPAPAPAAAPSAAPSADAVLLPRKGDVIKPFSATGMDGVVHQVDFAKGPTLLLFFLSSCPACHRMLPEWSSAYAKRAPGVTVWGIVLDQPPPSFFVVTPVAFPVLQSPGRDFMRLLNVQRVPTTVRVAPGGKVEDAFLGQLDPIRLGEFFRP